MIIFGRFVFGSICIWFGKLHYRHEIRPYAAKNGYTRAQCYKASLRAHKQGFDEAWPQEGEG